MTQATDSDKKRILLQLDPDSHPSVFDGVVAVDAGADILFRHGGVTPEQVRELTYGLMFTRGGSDLRNSAIFIGGSDVAASDALLAEVTHTFFGPVRVSVMADPSGANTTAAAAVYLASQHLDLEQSRVLVLGSTGPVGQRVVRLLARCNATVAAASRSLARAEQVAEQITAQFASARIEPVAIGSPDAALPSLAKADAVIAAGAPGVELLSKSTWEQASLELLIDLNAVPPTGIEGIEPSDRMKSRSSAICYGALGVGQTKMKLHKLAIASLFEANDRVLDVDAIFDLTRSLA